MVHAPTLGLRLSELPQLDFDGIGPRIGERFPDVVLPNQWGDIVDLHSVRANRRALFVVYRSADW